MATRASDPDLDRIVREARREINAPDLLRGGVPFDPGLYYIVVEPVKPRTTSGGEHGAAIALAADTQEADSYQVVVGRVLKCGPEAFSGRTASGIDLSNFRPDIRQPADLIGKYVVYQRHTGNVLTLRKTGQKIIVLTLSELLGVTDEPDAWRFYVG